MHIAYAALATIYTALVFWCGRIYQGARDIETVANTYPSGPSITYLEDAEAKWADTESQFD